MSKHHFPDTIARAALTAAALAGCAGGSRIDIMPPPVTPPDDRVPIADAYLDRSYATHAGLLAAIGPDGLPVTGDPAAMDPAILETRRFYDTVQYPFAQPQDVDYPDPFTGEEVYTRSTAPLTLDLWKQAFGFSPRGAGESVHAWRARTGAVVYFNQNELGLGRELGCAQFVDGQAADGSTLTGVACFVTNYGAAFNDPGGSLDDAANGSHPRNTVCISYRPSFEADYQVQFYTFGPDGKRVDWAQLDTLGPRPHPQVCMNCHGGSYDADRHLARRARFLPLDPAWLRFDADGLYTREAQEDSIRQLNALSLLSPLTGAQVEQVHGMYGGAIEQAGRRARPFVPAGWSASPEDADLYGKVVRPYCGTCHLAVETDASGVASPMYRAMAARAGLAGTAAAVFTCGFQMPNAQPTMGALWRVSGDSLTIGATIFPSAADALLDTVAGPAGRDACTELARAADCRRSADPDALCGDARSGTACDRDTGRCVTGKTPPSLRYDPRRPTGVCRSDGTRGCPATQECRAEDTGIAGYDGACYTCGRLGTVACVERAAPCEAGLVVGADGACGVVGPG